MNPHRFRWLGVVALCAGFIWAASTPTQANPLLNPSFVDVPIIQLTDNPANDVRPMWSPDGKQIAFQSNRDGPYHIYLMNADGTNQRALTTSNTQDRHPAWTPDGKTIIYDSNDGTSEELWALNIADGSRKQLTKLGGLASFAAVSPDGKRLIFYLYKNETMDIWTANVDGSDAKPLTTNLASASRGNCTFACHPVAWSKDGQLLAYSGGDHKTIWTMKADGTESVRVVADQDHHHFPWFLSDGRIGFITEHVGPTRAWTDAWAYDTKSKQRQLLQDQMALQGPMEWSPDETRLLFHSPRVGNFDIFVIDLTMKEGISALQGTPIPLVKSDGAKSAPTARAPASAATAFAPAPGSTPETAARPATAPTPAAAAPVAPAATTQSNDSPTAFFWLTGLVVLVVLGLIALVGLRQR